jgi:hypothetical protein
MNTITNEHGDQKGWIALIAVNLMAFGTLAFLVAAVSGAATFGGMVHKKELRRQAALNLTACLDSLSLMAEKDYFLKGTVTIREFGCSADVQNDFSGTISLSASAVLSGVTARDGRTIHLKSK